MSMRKLIWAGAIAAMAVAGCTGQGPRPGEVKGAGDLTLDSTTGGCYYPYGCGQSNGTGVYYQERGQAGMGDIHFLVTHFINTGTAVNFDGRYQNPTDGKWYYIGGKGQVYNAVYFGQNYTLISVSESGTNPVFIIQDSYGRQYTVQGGALQYLQLDLFVDIPGLSYPYYEWELSFGYWNTVPSAAGNSYVSTPLTEFPINYRDLIHGGSATSYCTNADGTADQAVFQGGINVLVESGKMGPNSTFVTMSCRNGAIATVYNWGYSYVTDQWHYAAGIHMKRASYCGNGEFYTVMGTQLTIADDWYNNWNWSSTGVEAMWTPNGASCFTQSRRPDGNFSTLYWWAEPAGSMLYHSLDPFDSTTQGWWGAAHNKTCGATVLPACPATGTLFDQYGDPNQSFLVSGIVPGQTN